MMAEEMSLKNSALSSRAQSRDPVAKLNGLIAGFFDSASLRSERHAGSGEFAQ
jgi:hypothetical protein